jgi:hypothetical protein
MLETISVQLVDCPDNPVGYHDCGLADGFSRCGHEPKKSPNIFLSNVVSFQNTSVSAKQNGGPHHIITVPTPTTKVLLVH